MPPERLIELPVGPSPSGQVPTPAAGPGLPEDLLRQTCRRLGIAGLVWAAVWLAGVVMNNVVLQVGSGRIANPGWPWPGNLIAAISILLSLGLFAHTHHHSCDLQRALDLGLIYEVFLALGIGILNQWVPPLKPQGVSWIALLILAHSLLVPATPGKTLLATLVAASMDPLGVAIAGARGQTVPPSATLAVMYVPNYIAAFMAVLASHIITRLGHHVRHAREMGSYRLGQLLGRGGMGEVYRAEHRVLQRPAAIKLIRPDASGGRSRDALNGIVRRFRREAEAVATLRSPHTIALYDFGVTSDGVFYYVMELLDGLDLGSLVERFGPLPSARVVSLLRQVCHSLAEAHAKGLIHRDVKPANIYTCRMGLDLDFVKVLDFGLVKAVHAESPEQSLATAPGLATGTPAFMAPELALGERTIDRRADIYALGCVAYWLLTGQLVFQADTTVKMMYEHVATAPVPPSQRTELEIPGSLEGLILSCLAKDPEQRPSDAEELSRRLAACEVGEPWTPERAARWWQTHAPEVRPAE